MDWLTFISEMTASLAWPLVVVGGGMFFRRQISGLATRFRALLDDRVEEASIGREGLSLRRKVAADLEKAEKELPALETTKGQVSPWSNSFGQELEQLAAINPAAAIASASARLESALREVLRESGADLARRPLSLSRLLTECVRRGLLSENEANAGRYLSQIRNEAVHQNVATIDQAQEFGDLALRIATAARLAIGQTAPDGDPL